MRQKQVGRKPLKETVRMRVPTVVKSIRLIQANWDLIDRNRIPMQLSQSQFIAYCVRKVARPYDVARAQQRESTA